MKNLKATAKLVKEILESDEQSRNDDNYLYYRVIEYHCEHHGITAVTLTVPNMLLGLKEILPPFESVRRARQKVQALHPELAACRKVDLMRYENKQMYLDFARSDEI